jgi:hypothetical protein
MVFPFYKRSIAAVALSVIAGLVAIDLKSESSLGHAAWLANTTIAVAWLLYLRDAQFAAQISAVTAAWTHIEFFGSRTSESLHYAADYFLRR